jgi:NIMA-interacting peptidyl-prolyl cis-trans isomerase 4
MFCLSSAFIRGALFLAFCPMASKAKESTHIQIHTDNIQCEKHAKKEEALEKLRNGTKFDEVAREFSEDKARQG